MHRLIPLAFFSLTLLVSSAHAEQAGRTVEAVAAAARKSVAVITVRGRDGQREGLGTGFVVAADGLIATNRHVVGDGRPIGVELDGKDYEVTAIHASDRDRDLAILKIDATGLTPLPLGDAKKLKDGQTVVALGNPRGLKLSVVAGVVSGQREIDGRSMLQLAIPIEAGNSGGPVLDLEGRVQGVLTIKSLVTPNLGFAVAVNLLRPLLAKPNPVPMSAWLTIGQLDRDEWLILGAARWRQRAGRISVEGSGSGIGGRAQCLAKQPPPVLPYEIAVTVKLHDEAGAAGLSFWADAGDKHYGFYPSNGQVRLTRFEGSDVFTWHVLKQETSPHYRSGEWNTLKVHLEKERIRCFVNEHLVYDLANDGWSVGQAGLCKFRDTVAEFKNFRIAKTIAPEAVAPAAVERVNKAIAGLGDAKLDREVVRKLAPDSALGVRALRDKAEALERRAAEVKHLAQEVHQQAVLAELTRVTAGDEEQIDLIHAALLLARLDNEELDIEPYRAEVTRMAKRVGTGLAMDATAADKLAALDRYLFVAHGYHGSRGDYYNRANSYLSTVIDDREGLPITLSVLYVELARRLGLRVEGVGLPGHFIVRYVPADEKTEPFYIDVFDNATRLTKAEALKRAEAALGFAASDEVLAAVSKKKIVARMLHNLLNIAEKERDSVGMLRYLDAIVVVDPESVSDRGLRAVVRAQTGDKQGALIDVDWLLEKQPDGVDLERLRQFRETLLRPGSR